MDDARLIVPPLDAEPWPTLGPELIDWYQDSLCHGPGDVIGQPITPEERLYLYRAYEIYPREQVRALAGGRGDTTTEPHPHAGRRRFKRCTYSRRKGARKTELAAWIAIGEMDPNAPVRCDGWRLHRGEWVPSGRGVVDPFIPMVAYTEEQVEDLAYAAVYEILLRCALRNDYDVGYEQIKHRNAPGKIAPYANAPSARDGARTTHQHFDETHLFVLEKLRKAHRTMLRNVPKRFIADAWSHETTTMYGPGEGSVAEGTHIYAEAIAEGLAADPRLMFDHRQAGEHHDIHTDAGLRAAVLEASGDAHWSDIEGIVSLFNDPAGDEDENRRYWLNQRRKSAKRWLSMVLWPERLGRKTKPPRGTEIVIAFDGSYNRDSTVLVGATVEARPHLFVIDAWEKPIDQPAWRVKRTDVDDALAKAMQRWTVMELAPDPSGWHKECEDWELAYGDVVVRFESKQPTRFGPACEDFEQGFKDDEFTHDGDPRMARHVGNCTTVERAGYTIVVKPDRNPDITGRHAGEHIDIAVGAIVAHHRARWHHANRVSSEPMIASVGRASGGQGAQRPVDPDERTCRSCGHPETTHHVVADGVRTERCNADGCRCPTFR